MKAASRWHRPVQLVTLILFLILFVVARRPGHWPLPTDLFVRLDPLAGLSSGLAGRAIPIRFAPSLSLVAITLLLGRVWCGWLCPLGTMLDLVGGPVGRYPSPRRLHRLCFLILFALVGAALLANQTLLILDPLTLLTRALDAITMLGRWGVMTARAVSHGNALTVAPAPYLPALLTLLFWGAVLALSRISRRFWCRVLCPLGALLGLVARVGWLRRRVGEGCSACGQCARECPVGAPSAARGYDSDPSHCIVCLSCQTRCPQGAVTFRGTWSRGKWREKACDPSRRLVLVSLGGGALGGWLLRSWSGARRPNPEVIRPPGAQEAELLRRCIRCGECVKVCPSAGLQPIALESGWEGLWTPALVPRLGWCSYECCRCGQVCPTGAIPRLTLEEKRRTVMGTARIDPQRCLSWGHLRVCTVCHDTCPLPPAERAILLEKAEVVDDLGQKWEVQRPRVVEELCIGCGICEYNCPVAGQAAIRVHAFARAGDRRGFP